MGVAAQWLAWRFKFPAILLLLAAGFALGQWVAPSEVIPEDLLAPLVSLSVAVILFEGGLSLKFRDLTETGAAIARLVTVGCLVTWALAAVGSRLLVFETWQVAALAGAILTVTGPTVIGPLLRHVRPSRRAAAVARWEGIVIDPIGAALAVLVYEVVQLPGGESVVASATWVVIKTAASGLIVGGVAAIAVVLLLRRHLVPDYLDAPVVLAFVIAAYTLADAGQHEAGLFAVTVMGIALANQKIVDIEHLTKFKESLGVLLVSLLFVVLSGRLRPEDMAALGWTGAAFIAALVLLVRPLAVLAATARSPLTTAERAFLAWLAPRGIVAAAVSSVFAIELARKGSTAAIRADADLLVPLTFSVIVTTVALYGLTSRLLARRLGVAEPDPQGLLIVGAGEFARAVAKAVQEEGFTVRLVDSNREDVKAARLDGLQTRHGNILSEQLQEDLDLVGIGRLLAMSSSDEVNALAAIAFTDAFERSGVYQLTTPQIDKKQKGQGGENRPIARKLFAPEATYSALDRHMKAGAVIKKTVLTEEFNFSAFKQQYGARAIPLFVIGRSGTLTVCTASEPLNPNPGQKLISLVDQSDPPMIASQPSNTKPPTSADST